MRFASLGSGSEGNALLIECGPAHALRRILIDCGFGLREATRRLERLGVTPVQIDAIFVTHEHGDHIGGAARLAVAAGATLYMTAGTAVVSPDSPPAFGNLFAYRDDIVPWLRRMTDEIHEHGAAAMIQISHLGRRTGWGQDDWLPVLAPSPIREPAHRSHPKAAEEWDIDRIVRDHPELRLSATKEMMV